MLLFKKSQDGASTQSKTSSGGLSRLRLDCRDNLIVKNIDVSSIFLNLGMMQELNGNHPAVRVGSASLGTTQSMG